MPGGKNQINVYGTSFSKRIYVAANGVGHRTPLLMQAGLLWLLEHPEHREAAVARFRELDALGDMLDAEAFMRDLEARAAEMLRGVGSRWSQPEPTAPA